MPRREPADPVAALTLRACILRALADPAARDARALDAAGHCSLTTWNLVLHAERCALALRSALSGDGAPPPIPAPAARLLNETAIHELRRNLSAQAQLRMLGEVALEHGWRVVVLKGAVGAAAGAAIDLSDIDVVARPDEARALAAALDARGYTPYGAGSRSHFAPRLKPGGVQIEVHHAVAFFEELPVFLRHAVPLDGVPGLFAPDPADHLWHLLVHSVLYHPDRRGRIRDLLLIGRTAVDSSPDAVREVERRIDAHTGASPLRATLAMARELDHAPGPTERFARVNRDKYFLACQPVPLARGFIRARIFARATWFLDETRSLFGEIHATMTATIMDPTTVSPIAWLMRWSPRIGGFCRRLLRVGQLVLAYAVITAARRRAQRALPLPRITPDRRGRRRRPG